MAEITFGVYIWAIIVSYVAGSMITIKMGAIKCKELKAKLEAAEKRIKTGLAWITENKKWWGDYGDIDIEELTQILEGDVNG